MRGAKNSDDQDAKAVARQLLEELGWRDIIDLGPLRTARGVEMLLPLWISLSDVAGTAHLNIKLVRQ